MLLRFNVNNFLSFNSEQEFSMNPGTATTFDYRVAKFEEQSILKFSSLYGANASGKSNLVKAIDFSRRIIVEGIEELDSTEKYYKLDKENVNLPTKFEYDLKIKDKYYGYGFSVNLRDKKVLNEWLVELNRDEDKVIYEREPSSNYKYQNIDWIDTEESKKFDLQMDLVNEIENVLLISEVSRRKNNSPELEVLHEIYNWFKNELLIIYPNSVVSDMTNIFKNSDDRLVDLLKYFDTGIHSYELSPSSLEQIQQYIPREVFETLRKHIEITRKKINESEGSIEELIAKGTLILGNHLFKIEFKTEDVKINEILFKHSYNDETFTFGEESDGTRRLIELLDIIYNDSQNRTVIIDELDRSLHPQMTIKFVETFLKYSKDLMTQLIITTHESNLMDLKLLRRDEIWFVERDIELNESKLYSLEKFKVHNTKKVAKDYLIGRYGAVPVFKDFDSYLGKLDGNSEI